MFVLSYLRKCCQLVAGSVTISAIDVNVAAGVAVQSAEPATVMIEVGPAACVATEVETAVEAGEYVEIND